VTRSQNWFSKAWVGSSISHSICQQPPRACRMQAQREVVHSLFTVADRRAERVLQGLLISFRALGSKGEFR
jgi:hypothetical protein